MFVYLITNQRNGKKYVGQTVQTLEKRWKRHRWESTLNRNAMAITKALAAHGAENFRIEELEHCTSLEALNEAERKWIKDLDTISPNGYNLTSGGNSQGHLSEETKRKISAANQGRKCSAETRKRLSESHKGWVPSQTTREKWRKAFTGKKQDPMIAKARTAKLAKTYTMIAPDGSQVIFTNMKEFCAKHGLSESKMNEVVNGKRLGYKGWRKGVF